MHSKPLVGIKVQTLPICNTEMICSVCSSWTIPMSPNLQWLEQSGSYHFHLGSDWGGVGSLPWDKHPQVDWALLLALPRRPHRPWRSSSTIPFSPSPGLSNPWDVPLLLAQTCLTHFSTKKDRSELFCPLCGKALCSPLLTQVSLGRWTSLCCGMSEWLLSWLVGWWMNQSGHVGLELIIGGIHSLCKGSWWMLVRLWWGTLLLGSL